jgi:hypothetical protein
MANYASGKRSKAISDRSGMEFPYKEMVREWNGSLVHVSEFEPKQPQLEPKPHGADAIALRHVRTGRYKDGLRDASSDYITTNFFFFTVDTNTATSGNVKGGGYGCSVGPVTIEA